MIGVIMTVIRKMKTIINMMDIPINAPPILRKHAVTCFSQIIFLYKI